MFKFKYFSIKQKNFLIFLSILSILILALSFVYFISFIDFQNYAQSQSAAISPEEKEYFINLDQETINKGYTINALDNNIKLSLTPGILTSSTVVEIIKINNEEMSSQMPWELRLISKIYQFDFKNKNSYNHNRPFYVQINYFSSADKYKKLFFYDKNYEAWRPLPTKDYPKEKFVRSLIHLPFARIAVFANSDLLINGKASWYKYKDGDYAASPDFPKGSELRVYNIENNKFIDIIINDYGPNRNLHPDRVIDLDKLAFAKIASLNTGTINVKIEPKFISEQRRNNYMNFMEAPEKADLEINAKSAIIINAKNNKILYQKNSTTTLPIASLTKILAVKTFLDINPDLNQKVSYNIQDEKQNHRYANKWESTKIKLKHGDRVIIQDLIYASLIMSANNTVETLVRVSGLSRDEFVDKMNKTAINWGASSTHFIEPTGLSPENISSAKDYAIISQKVFEFPVISKASAMAEYKFTTINTQKKFKVKNINTLLQTNKYNITGSKTGYLDEIGYCLIVRVDSKTEQFIIVLLGAKNRDESLKEVEKMIKYTNFKHNNI